jgi:hypothetical protein
VTKKRKNFKTVVAKPSQRKQRRSKHIEMTTKNPPSTPRMDDCVAAIATNDKVTGLIARKRYYDGLECAMRKGQTEAEFQDGILGPQQPATDSAEESAPAQPKKKRNLTLAETELGVTIVLSHEDCHALGYQDDQQASTIRQDVRAKLGLQNRKLSRTTGKEEVAE